MYVSRWWDESFGKMRYVGKKEYFHRSDINRKYNTIYIVYRSIFVYLGGNNVWGSQPNLHYNPIESKYSGNAREKWKVDDTRTYHVIKLRCILPEERMVIVVTILIMHRWQKNKGEFEIEDCQAKYVHYPEQNITSRLKLFQCCSTFVISALSSSAFSLIFSRRLIRHISKQKGNLFTRDISFESFKIFKYHSPVLIYE